MIYVIDLILIITGKYVLIFFVLRRKIVCIKTPKWLKIWEKQHPRFEKGFNRVSAILGKPSEVLINYSLFFRVIYIPIPTPLIDIFKHIYIIYLNISKSSNKL